MKTLLDPAVFGRRLREALEERRDVIERLSFFRTKGFKKDSGADFTLFWNHSNPDEPITPNTARNWLRGTHFPKEKNWPLLEKTVGKTRRWLVGLDDSSTTSFSITAQPFAVYSDDDASRMKLALIDEIADLNLSANRKLKQLKSLG